MEKYAVEIDKELEKKANQGRHYCPKCGRSYGYNGQVPLCPNCGTEPFEKKKE